MNQTVSQILFDRAGMLERLGGDEQLLDEVLSVFMEELPLMVDDIRTAVSGQSAETVMRAAHSIKGALLNISAESSADLACKLEELGRTERLDGSRELLAELEVELGRLERAISGSGA
jgi:HPt (histidine-containing phosphotransfer) domain-containing protein